MVFTGSQLAAQAQSRVRNISPDIVHADMQEGTVTLIDVREADELTTIGQIDGAIHIPRGMLEFVADPGSPYFNNALSPENSLVITCASGLRSALATETLQQLGFSDVANMTGGVKEWIRQGLPIQFTPTRHYV